MAFALPGSHYTGLVTHLRSGLAALAVILVSAWIIKEIDGTVGLLVGVLLLTIIILWDSVSSKRKRRFPNVRKVGVEATLDKTVPAPQRSDHGPQTHATGSTPRPGSVGIHIEGGSDITLTNNTIRGFDRGIVARAVTRLKAKGNRID
jgi:parallel beta-helix repeat protein